LEVPILFSTAMVKAILKDKKTKTRRVIKPQPSYSPGYIGEIQKKKGLIEHICGAITMDELLSRCPYGEPGDILWVRETWQQLPSGFDEIPPENWYIYKASDELSKECTKWRPSIFMPREACRLFLKVKSIRIEQLQDITEEDAGAEGVDFCCPSQRHGNWKNRWISGYCHNCKYHDPMTGKKKEGCPHYEGGIETRFQWWCGCNNGFELRADSIPEPYRFKFAFVWNELGQPPFWNQNPWVWVVEFERIKNPINYV
jgi:hypothetical protein